MRKIVWAAATAAGLAVVSAGHAGERAAAPAMPSTGTVIAVAVPLVPDLQRVEPLLETPFADDPFNRLKGTLRHRFASQMIDLYPAAASGFHASFGTRFFKRATIRRDQEAATNGLLYSPRTTRGAIGGVRGFRRATAAATVGYTELLRPNLMVGVEGGSLLGRAVQASPIRRAGLQGTGTMRGERAMRTNPVVNVTLAYAF